MMDLDAALVRPVLTIRHGDGGVNPLLQTDVLDLDDALVRPVLTGLGSWGSYNSSYLIKYTVLHYNVACSQVRYVPSWNTLVGSYVLCLDWFAYLGVRAGAE